MMLHFDLCKSYDTSTLAVADSNDYAGVRARYVLNEVAEDTSIQTHLHLSMKFNCHAQVGIRSTVPLLQIIYQRKRVSAAIETVP